MIFPLRSGTASSGAALLRSYFCGLQKSDEPSSMFRMDARVQKACFMHYDVADGLSIFYLARRP